MVAAVGLAVEALAALVEPQQLVVVAHPFLDPVQPIPTTIEKKRGLRQKINIE